MHRPAPKGEEPVRRQKNDPYELWIVAGLFLLPGLLALTHHGSALIVHAPTRYVHGSVTEVVPEGRLHLYGWLAVLVAMFATALYFYLRREFDSTKNYPNARRSLEKPAAESWREEPTLSGPYLPRGSGPERAGRSHELTPTHCRSSCLPFFCSSRWPRP